MYRPLRAFTALILAFTTLVAVAPPASASETFAEVAADPIYTDKHANAFRLYWAALDREPDAGGARYSAGIVDQCVGLDVIADSFVVSDEFRLRYGDLNDRDYVTRIYLNVLDRTPDEEGCDYWVGLMESGQLTRAGVLLYFSLSQEFINNVPLPSTGKADRPCGEPVGKDVYANCTDVWNTIGRPITRDDRGYSSNLDRDGDGVGCENDPR